MMINNKVTNNFTAHVRPDGDALVRAGPHHILRSWERKPLFTIRSDSENTVSAGKRNYVSTIDDPDQYDAVFVLLQ